MFLIKNLDEISTPESTPKPAPEPTVFSTSKLTKKPNKFSPKFYTNVWDRTANWKQIFIKYSKYHNPSFLLKDLHKASEAENDK